MRTAIILLPPVAFLLLPLLVALLAWRLSARRWLAVVAGLLCGTALLIALTFTPPRLLRTPPRGSEAEADSFVVFSFGMGQPAEGHETPGESNRWLARWLVEHNPRHKPTVV